MLSTRHRFLFVHIPKTAGNAVQTILRNYADDEIVSHKHQDGVEMFGVRSPQNGTRKHSTLATYRREYGKELYGSLFKFACVRDPWQRAISFIFSRHRGEVVWNRQNFVELVATMKPVADFLSASETEVQPLAEAVRNVDFLMRFESLEADFGRCRADRHSGAATPGAQSIEAGRLRSYDDDEMRELVGTSSRRKSSCSGMRSDEAGDAKREAYNKRGRLSLRHLMLGGEPPLFPQWHWSG